MVRRTSKNKADDYFVSDKVLRFHDIANMFLNKKSINIKHVYL